MFSALLLYFFLSTSFVLAYSESRDEVIIGTSGVEKPLISAQHDYPMPFNPYGGSAGGYGGGFQQQSGDTVHFDFNCKCNAKSNLAKNLQTPTDSNQAAQQQIQQLQEQVRKLQEQINRSQQGKSSFEQFAQMLSLADGLDCSCSGASSPFNNFPSGVGGSNPYGGNRFTGIGGQGYGQSPFLGGQSMGLAGGRFMPPGHQYPGSQMYFSQLPLGRS